MVTKKNKIPQILTPTLLVKWSNLLKPDVAFGENAANHNITVVVDAEFKATLDGVLKSSGATKINGLRDFEGVLTFKAKSTQQIDKGKFPCVDSAAQVTEVVAFGGDKVRLKLAPMVIARDNSLSIYLNGIQIIEKNTSFSGASSGFDPVEGGYVATPLTPQQDSDLPF